MNADGLPARLYRSTDNGSNWQTLHDFQDYSVTALVADPHNPLHLFAGTDGDGNTPVTDEYVFQSYDGGVNWIESDFGTWLPACGNATANIAIDSSHNPAHIYFANTNNGVICRSLNGGQTWEPYFIWSQHEGMGQAEVVDINLLPPEAAGAALHAQAVTTQSLMLMGATTGVYSRVLVDENSVYLPIILKASS
jgi:hypothetical protein